MVSALLQFVHFTHSFFVRRVAADAPDRIRRVENQSTRCFNGTDFCPTVDMAVKYYRPMMIGDKMIVKARILRLGKTLTHIFCEVRSQDTGKLVATANTTFLSDSAGNENNSGKTKTDEDRKSTEDTIVFEKSIEHEKDKSVKKTAFSGGYIRNIINNSDKL